MNLSESWGFLLASLVLEKNVGPVSFVIVVDFDPCVAFSSSFSKQKNIGKHYVESGSFLFISLEPFQGSASFNLPMVSGGLCD